ncbi:MAG TPA: hypothetical protein VEJ63_19915 [Planctomycetota bacterium]|nr:hypothetical protein [Planctomycetota bacterium]
MSDKPRRFWQIHLSTAVALMLISGVIIGLQFSYQYEPPLHPDGDSRGWPFPWNDEPDYYYSHGPGLILNVPVWLTLLLMCYLVFEHALKLSRPRVYLSTLIIVSLLAAGLGWLNVTEQSHRTSFELGGREYHATIESRGWPLHYESAVRWAFPGPQIQWWKFTLNVVICLALLACAAVAIEWLTRRVKRGAR